ncbi:hypothetical protein ACFXGR_52750, partial [Streptomyces mirabilis]|uniref:hypothetical protein n=1 Tax=Streptomyces mirabilis TaxID=68239 RepID=UPI00368A3CC3
MVGECGGQPLHHVGDEGVGSVHGAARVVQEPVLLLLPAQAEPFLILGGQELGGLVLGVGARGGGLVLGAGVGSHLVPRAQVGSAGLAFGGLARRVRALARDGRHFG